MILDDSESVFVLVHIIIHIAVKTFSTGTALLKCWIMHNVCIAGSVLEAYTALS